jgi:uncharacterized membrane protein YhaH (DUF805 family)
MQWMLMPYRRYAEFSGRSRRKEYWMFTLFNVIVGLVIAMLMFGGLPLEAMSNPGAFALNEAPGPLFWLGAAVALVWGLGTIIPSIAVTVRRLHDRNMSGWWYLAFVLPGLIPVAGDVLGLIASLAMLVVLALPGTPGPNKYGLDPKDPAQAEVFA